MLIKGPALPRAVQYWIPVFTLLVAFLLPVKGFSGDKERKIDSLKSTLATQKDTFRINTLTKITQSYYSLNRDSAIHYGRILKSAAEEYGDSARMCDAYVIVGSCYHHLQMEDSAMYYKRLGMTFGRAADYPKGETNALNDIGLYMKERGDLDSAIYYVLESIRIREENSIEKPLGVSYVNLGLIYYFNGDTVNALGAYRKAEELGNKFGDIRVQTAVLNNVAAIYDERRQYDSSMACYRKLMNICDSIGDEEGLARTMINLAVTLRSLGQLERAERMLLDAISIKQKVEDVDGEAIGCMELSRTYLALKNYSLSEKYIVIADTLALRLKQKDIQREVYLIYSELYQATGRLAQALAYYKLYHQLNEEIVGAEKQQVIEELRTRFDIEKKDKENALLREQQLADAEAIAEGDRRMKLLVAGLIAALLVIGLAFYSYRIKIKSNALLAAKNEQISKQNSTLKELNKKLIDSEEELTQLNATKDELFSIISHDLGNPVNAIVNYNTVLRNQKETMTKEEMAQSLDKVNLTLQPLQGFLDNLLHWSIQQRNGIVVRKEDVNVKEVVAEIIALYNASLLTKRVTIQTEVSPLLSAHTDRNILRLIVRNLLGNAIKFSPPESTVHVKCSSQDGKVVLEFRNRGNKIEPQKIAAILEGKPVNSERGWLQEQGTGLGLSLVTQYLRAMGGKLEMESDEQETTVRVIS